MKYGDKMCIWGFLVGCMCGVFIVCLLFAFGLVHAQEGCGEWLSIRWMSSAGEDGGRVAYISNVPKGLEFPDSVWVFYLKKADMETVWTHANIRAVEVETVYVPYNAQRAKKCLSEITESNPKAFFLAEYFFDKWQRCIAEPDTCGYWKYRWVKQECMRSLDLSGIQNLMYRPPDTCWQQERYWIPDTVYIKK